MSAPSFITMTSVSTTSAIEPGSIAIDSSGAADNGTGTVGESVSGAVIGVVTVGKDAVTTAASEELTIQTSGLAKITITAGGVATTAGARMILSAATASLATVAATYGTTFAGIGVRGDYLGPVVIPGTTTDTTAVIDLRLQ